MTTTPGKAGVKGCCTQCCRHRVRAGTQCMIRASKGHRVYGIDINEPLIELARKRAQEAGLQVLFSVGSAVRVPWPDQSMHVCLLPELLEHVVEWMACLKETARILRPGGVLFLSTTNKLCPVSAGIQPSPLQLVSASPEASF
jgi:2-polyprenyl-3-methyl-5-hydroxy-6-metoxy-1,4-benzoquinol methylase